MPGLALVELAVGLLLMVLGLVLLLRDRRRRAEWPSYPGRVVTSRLDDGKIRYQVTYRRDGREATFWNRYYAVTDPVGREVEVLVNPDDPDDALVSAGNGGGSRVGLGLAAFGLLVVVLSRL